jgi:hypothetical protein
MNRYRFLAFSVIGILILGPSFFLWNRAQANLQLSTEIGYEQNAPLNSEGVTQDLSGNIPAGETGEPDVAGNETFSNSFATMEVIGELLNKSYSIVYNPGWIYIEEEHIGDRDTMIPEGVIYPEPWYRIGWYHVNDDLLVDKYVHLDKGGQGDLFQITVFTDGYSWNSFYGDITAVKPFRLSRRDRVVLDSILNSPNASPFVDLVDGDGSPTYIFTRSERIEPLDVHFETLGRVTVVGMEVHDNFDAETGSYKKLLQFVFLEGDENPQLLYEVNYKTELDAQPPQEIFDLIEKYRVSK